MGSIMSMDLDPTQEEMYECLLDHVLCDVAAIHKCELKEFSMQEITNLPADLVSAECLTLQEEKVLVSLFLEHNAEVQHILCNYFFNAYPVVCDVAVDVVAKLLNAKAANLFDIYLIIGGYGDLGEGTYHAWAFVVGKQSGAGCYIDLTYIQFREEGFSIDCVRTADGNIRTILNFETLRDVVSHMPEAVTYPTPVIPYSTDAARRWLPSHMARVII